METLFLNTVNISITASWVILAVIAIRLFFKKAPKSYRILLWSFVGIRLTTPISIESKNSLIPSANTLPTNITSSIMPSINSGISSVDKHVNYIISESIAKSTSDTLVLDISKIFAWIWIGGIVILCGYCLFSYLKLYFQTRASIHINENVYVCDFIESPFILGFINPKIYVPSNIEEAQLNNILKHEYAHIKRKDFIWKPIGYILLTLHWFNPLVWLSYSLMCKDIELACDEKAIKNMTSEEKKIYSQTLLDFSIQKYSILMCPVAFAEVGIKERVKAVLEYKKAGLYIFIICLLITILSVSTLMVNPISKRTFIAQISNVLDNGIIIADMDSEHYDSYFISFKDFDENLYSTIKLGQLYTMSVSKDTSDYQPPQFKQIYDIQIYEEDPNNRLPLVMYSSPTYADLRNAIKIEITKENFSTYFEIEEVSAWGNGSTYPHLIYTLKLNDAYQLANADNNISYTYTYDVVKRFLSVDNTNQITWIHEEVLKTKQESNSYDKIGPSMSLGNDFKEAYYYENDEVYILAKENFQIQDVEGTIYVAKKNTSDTTMNTILNHLKQYDNGIHIDSYTEREDELCTHPRGVYKKANIQVNIVSEPHVFHTYFIDVTNTTIDYVQRIYFDEKYYTTICDYLINLGFILTE